MKIKRNDKMFTRTSVMVLGALMLSSCAGLNAPAPPSQPTPASVEATHIALAGIITDQLTEPARALAVWGDGDYAVRAACHAYLNSEAARANNLSVASAGIGNGGIAAAGFLMSGGNPLGSAAALGISSLVQTFLGQYQTAGALPYSNSTATIIEHALDAYETGVDASPPQTVALAMSEVDDLWFKCSPGGYAQLISTAINTAQVTTTPISGLSPVFSMRSIHSNGRPQIYVNGH